MLNKPEKFQPVGLPTKQRVGYESLSVRLGAFLFLTILSAVSKELLHETIPLRHATNFPSLDA